LGPQHNTDNDDDDGEVTKQEGTTGDSDGVAASDVAMAGTAVAESLIHLSNLLVILHNKTSFYMDFE
jgi:hypothetical protein